MQSISNGTWKVSGVTFAVTSSTQITGRAVVGSSVSIEGYRSSTGALLADDIVVRTSSSGGGDD